MNPATLVYINSNDEKEINKLLKTIEEKREQIEKLTVSIEDLKAEVDLFQHRYNAYVGRYYLELDKVELETKEYRLRLQLHREDVSEQEIEARVESCFRENRARFSEPEDQKESELKSETNDLPEQEAKYLQSLYRKLAKRFHPDKAAHTEEKHRRKQLMPLINRAYNEQDVRILERLSIGETDIAMQAEGSIAEKKERLQTKLRSLHRATSELRSEINRVKAGRTYQLKQQVENAEKSGSDLLTTLAADLKRKVQSSRAQLTRLINMWSRSNNS
jgi:FtsZ-binding cell division protein ZapB